MTCSHMSRWVYRFARSPESSMPTTCPPASFIPASCAVRRVGTCNSGDSLALARRRLARDIALELRRATRVRDGRQSQIAGEMRGSDAVLQPLRGLRLLQRVNWIGPSTQGVALGTLSGLSPNAFPDNVLRALVRLPITEAADHARQRLACEGL